MPTAAAPAEEDAVEQRLRSVKGAREPARDDAAMTCHCEQCRPDDPGPTYTEAFRLECLARQVAALPTLQARRGALDRWGAKHGVDAKVELREALRRVWETRAT